MKMRFILVVLLMILMVYSLSPVTNSFADCSADCSESYTNCNNDCMSTDDFCQSKCERLKKQCEANCTVASPPPTVTTPKSDEQPDQPTNQQSDQQPDVEK